MNQDFENTVMLWEHTRDHGSRGVDTFEPDVKVLLSWKDVEAAVAVGAVVPTEAYALWAYWAAPGSPARLAAQDLVRQHEGSVTTHQPVAPASAGLGGAASVSARPMVDTSGELLEMNDSSRPNQGEGMPSEIRVVLLVIVGALLVWAAGKVFGQW
jgi:hypothetical protein